MATLQDLVDLGEIVHYQANLDENEQPLRNVYFSQEAKNWVELSLVHSKATRNFLSAYEQMGNILHDFIIGRPITYSSQYHPLDPIGHYVWELKTADTRLIGWFPQKGFFVVVCGRFKAELLKRKLYDPCVAYVVWFRNNLDLDSPKMVMGAKANDVL